MIRDDLSNRLIHLVKGNYVQAQETFKKIIDDGVLLGSSSGVRGGAKVVCFSEAPINKLAQLIASSNVEKMRYRPFGVMFKKNYLFDLGARPVIYQPEAEYCLLNSDQQYRHVRFEPNKGNDFTWEREWRIKTERLSLDPESVTLIVPHRELLEEMKNDHHGRINRANMVVGFGASFVGKFPWHFVVLEDMGVDIPGD